MTQIPDDDGTRQLTIADPTDDGLPHVAVVGDVYTILMSTAQTAGKYCLIDMHIPPGGGPPPHRHDFEESFTVIDGEVDVTLRDQTSHASTGQTVNIPANVPHAFHNPSDQPLHLLCLAAPGGLDEYFLGFGDRVPSRNSPAPSLSQEEMGARMRRAGEIADRFGIDMLGADAPPADGA